MSRFTSHIRQIIYLPIFPLGRIWWSSQTATSTSADPTSDTAKGFVRSGEETKGFREEEENDCAEEAAIGA
jgi:hypothetical protein